MKLVYAKATCSTTDSATGLVIRLTESEPWSADDPFVKNRPDLFTDHPVRVRRTTPAPIEAATKTPGAKKAVKRDEW